VFCFCPYTDPSLTAIHDVLIQHMFLILPLLNVSIPQSPSILLINVRLACRIIDCLPCVLLLWVSIHINCHLTPDGACLFAVLLNCLVLLDYPYCSNEPQIICFLRVLASVCPGDLAASYHPSEIMMEWLWTKLFIITRKRPLSNCHFPNVIFLVPKVTFLNYQAQLGK
jgi:hypothetical protein